MADFKLENINLSDTRRILARTLLHKGKIVPLALIDATVHNDVHITPFDRETANTIFIDDACAIVDNITDIPAEISIQTDSLADINELLSIWGLYPAGNGSEKLTVADIRVIRLMRNRRTMI